MRPIRMLSRALAVGGLTVLVVVPAAGAAPAGSVDRSFGAGGVGLVHTSGSDALAVVPESGGELVLGLDDTQNELVARAFDGDGMPVDGSDATVRVTGAGQTSEGVDAAVLDPVSGRIIVFATVKRGSVDRGELLGLDADGRLDPGFGVAGRVLLRAGQSAGGLGVSPDGTILAASLTYPAYRVAGQLTFNRVSAAGVVLSSASVPADVGLDPPVVVALPDGSSLVAFDDDDYDPATHLVRFDAAGQSDPAFGSDGELSLGDGIAVDAAALDGSGDVLLAGAHLATYSRSGPTPANPLLMRVTPDGVVDPGFGRVGRGIGGAGELTSVAVDGDRILAGAFDGRLASFSAGDGAPETTFGVGGISPAPGPPFVGLRDPFAVDGDAALVAGGNGSHRHGTLTLTRVRLIGSGLFPPVAGRRVELSRVAGRVTVTVPDSAVAQPLTDPVDAALPIGQVFLGNDGIYPPTTTILGARHGTAAVDGVGGRALLRGGVVRLRRRTGAVATLVVQRDGCRPASLTLRGRFGIGAGDARFTVVSSRARVRVRVCDRAHPVEVLAGRVIGAPHGPRPPG